MSANVPQDLVVVVNTPHELFNAPEVNPFSDNTLEILGMSGLEYMTRRLQARRRVWKGMRLRVRMPPGQISADFEKRLQGAIRRYCQAKIEDNTLEIHLIRVRSAIGLGILLVVVGAIIAVTYLLFAGPLADIPKVVQAVIVSTISLFAWVSLWDPLEALLFNPIPLMRENDVLRRLTELQLVVESDAPNSGQNATDAIHSPFGRR